MLNSNSKSSGVRTRGCCTTEAQRGNQNGEHSSNVRNPGGLLDMLAEVASQTLHNDPTVKASPAKKRKGQKESVNKKRSELDSLTATKLRSLSVSQQLRLCSRLDGDEMRKTFTYTCLLEPDLCGQTFSSFGSEGRARQMMRAHLQEHLKNHSANEPISVNRRRRTTKVQVVKKKPSAKVKVETIRSSRQKYDNVYDESNSLPTSNKENKAESVSDWRNGERSGQKLQTLNLLKVVDSTAASSLKMNQNDDMKPDSVVVPESDEETLSCCSTGSKFDDHASQLSNHAMKSTPISSEHIDSDKSIYIEHSYTSRGTEHSTPSADGEANTSEVDGKQRKENGAPEILVCLMEDSLVNGRNGPSIGREVDISTEAAVKTIKSENLPVLRDNRREGGDPNRDYRIETIAVERDEFHQLKKPKGKAKFIGQSKAEKEMAIRLINAIKSKASPAGLHSLDTLECRICRPPRCFTAPTTLMSHYRSHAGIKPYECRICRAAFTRQHSLNYHMLIHSNQTRFTCHDCGRKFRHPSHFKEHRRRHTGESPFECSDCLLRFKTRNTYKRHLKTRHGKVLTTSGGLIILSEEEFKRVRTMPRSPPSSQVRTDHPKMEAESEEEMEEEDYDSTSGGDDASNHSLSVEPFEVVTIQDGITMKTEVDSDEVVEEVVSTRDKDRVMNLDDIVREVLCQNDEEEVADDSQVGVQWEVETVTEDNAQYASAVVQISESSEIQLYPVTVLGSKPDEPKVKVTSALPMSPILTGQESPPLDGDLRDRDESRNLANLLTGQKTPAAISQSLALLQSRYLVGASPGLNLTSSVSDAQQATVLLLANEQLVGRTPGTGAVAVANPASSDTISLMLA